MIQINIYNQQELTEQESSEFEYLINGIDLTELENDFHIDNFRTLNFD